MLAVTLTAILALYVLGPDLLFRWIVGCFAPAKFRKRTYGEQITAACLLAVIPFFLVWRVVGRLILDVYSDEHKALLLMFAKGVVAQGSYDYMKGGFFHSLPYVWKLNIWCLAALYALCAGLALFFGSQVSSLGTHLRRCEEGSKRRKVLEWVVKPWAAEWHLRLSPMLLPSKEAFIQADILTKMDVLFRGKISEHHLGIDGELVSISLERVKKFRRVEFLEERMRRSEAAKQQPARASKAAKSLSADNYWSDIPGHFFVVKADEIVTLNLSYVKKEPVQFTDADLAVLRNIMDRVGTSSTN